MQQNIIYWVKYANTQGFNMNGRARRSEYWYNWLFYTVANLILSLVMGIIDAVLMAISEKLAPVMVIINIFFFIISLAIFLKMLPITVRRLHDTGKSGWVYLLCILASSCCGIGSLVLIYFLILDSTPGVNQYGPNPKDNNGGNGTSGYNGGPSGQNNMGGQEGMYNEWVNQTKQQGNMNEYGQSNSMYNEYARQTKQYVKQLHNK